MSPTPGSGWSRSGTPRSPRATSASPHDFHIYVMDDDDDNDEEEKEKEKPSGDAFGEKRAAAAHRNIPTGPPKTCSPRTSPRYSWSAGRRRRRDDSGGRAAVMIPSSAAAAAARPKTPRRQRRRFSAARVRRASPTRTRRRRCSRVSAPLGTSPSGTRTSPISIAPGTRSRGSLRRRPGTAPSGAGTSLGSPSRRRRACSSTR